MIFLLENIMLKQVILIFVIYFLNVYKIKLLQTINVSKI